MKLPHEKWGHVQANTPVIVSGDRDGMGGEGRGGRGGGGGEGQGIL